MKQVITILFALCCLTLSPVRAQFVFVQQGNKLVGTGSVGETYQGWSSSLSADGNTAIVGGDRDSNDAGAAWVYTRSGGVWTQQGSKLVGTGAVGGAQQGISVSLSADGNTAIVGGYQDNGNAGAAWVYTRSGGVWTQQGSKLVGTGDVGGALQGWSLSLSADGNTAIVGGYSDNGFLGAAWVYTRSGGVWTQQGSKLVGTGAVGSAYQGWSSSLSADGNTAIVGGSQDNGNAGAEWVYTRSGGVWTQQGSKLVGTGAVGKAFQGRSSSLSADGNTAIVGGYADHGNVGAVWVYVRSAGVWIQQGSKLVGTSAVGLANQGYSVSISADGNTAIVGGFTDDGSLGAAWVYYGSEMLSVTLQHRWNMVSVPVKASDYAKTAVFPTAGLSNAFAFSAGGYVVESVLANGIGYWIDFDSAHSISMSGGIIIAESIDVVDGWNLVGSTSVAYPASSVASDPPGMITSRFFGYSGSYQAADTIQPGYGYWVKVNQAGRLLLSSSPSNIPSTLIQIIPGGEEPPPAPDERLMNTSMVIPSEFALGQNYPNPFNPATVISYQLPLASIVKLKIYNVLGQEVKTLVNGIQDAGYESITVDASALTSGVYYYKLEASDVSDASKAFTQVRKMILMK